MPTPLAIRTPGAYRCRAALDGSFPTQARVAINRPKAKQVPETRAKAQTGGETVKVNLDAVEKAMMREMEKTLQKGKPE